MFIRKNRVKLGWSRAFAYVVGIIATDGNLSPDLRHIHVTSKDYEIVANCKKYLGLKNKISKKGRGGSKEKKYYVLQFGDENFYDFLLELGLTPRKSKTISILRVPAKYFQDFLRGCIDGDGSISISKHPESRYPQYKLRLCSASRAFLDWILRSCRRLLGATGGSISKTEKSSVYTLTFAKQNSILLLKMIYSGNVICLGRKRKIALQIIKPGWRN